MINGMTQVGAFYVYLQGAQHKNDGTLLPNNGLDVNVMASSTFSALASLISGNGFIRLPSTGLANSGPPRLYYQVGPNDWRPVEHQSNQSHMVTATLTRFGYYAVFATLSNPPFLLENVNVSPNPWPDGQRATIRAQVLLADRLTYRIYNIAGVRVASGRFDSQPKAENGASTYEAPLRPEDFPPGVYVCIVTAEKANHEATSKRCEFTRTP